MSRVFPVVEFSLLNGVAMVSGVSRVGEVGEGLDQ